MKLFGSTRCSSACAMVVMAGVLATGSTASAVDPNYTETFSTGLNGWAGGSGPTLVPSGGPAGSGDQYLQISSNGTRNLATLNTGAQWIGDYGGNIAIPGQNLILGVRADLANFGTTPLSIRAIFFNTAINRYSTLDVAQVPADGVWRTYQWNFDPTSEAGLVSVAGTEPILTGMRDVTQIMFRNNVLPSAGGDNTAGTLGLDNIKLIPFIPSPGAASVLVIAGLAGTRRRRPHMI